MATVGAPAGTPAAGGGPRVSSLLWSQRPGRAPRPPDWVFDGIDPAGSDGFFRGGEDLVLAPRRAGETLIGARLPDAAALGRRSLRRQVADLYRRIRRAMGSAGSPYPIRTWNFLPAIHDPLGDGLDRYMAFNEGRHEVLSRWNERALPGGAWLPASTGVGHRGSDLLVYCLAGERPGRPTENPRQVPAYRYSWTYGPSPPWFPRATFARVGGREVLLVSGTAAVRGEASVHPGSLEGQIAETFANLDALLGAGEDHPPSSPPLPAWRFDSMRIYHRRRFHAGPIQSAVLGRFRGLRRLEVVQADICRKELLLEIEGVAFPASVP